MKERILFKLFLACLFPCAAMVLGGVWLQDVIASPLYFQVTATFFVIGLASFLLWFSLTLRTFVGKNTSP